MVHERQAMEIADINQSREQIAQSVAAHTALGLPPPDPGAAIPSHALAKLDAVRGLVASDPQRVAVVVKLWVKRDE